MVDSVDTNVLVSGSRIHKIVLTNESDGTGESNIVKIDKSTLIGPDGVNEPGDIAIMDIWWNVNGFDGVKLTADGTTDTLMGMLSGQGYFDFRDGGGLRLDNVAGAGDLLLTTVKVAAGAAGDNYWIKINCKLRQ